LATEYDKMTLAGAKVPIVFKYNIYILEKNYLILVNSVSHRLIHKCQKLQAKRYKLQAIISVLETLS